jgi:hypothetical protein
MDVLIDIFAKVFGVATARNWHTDGTPLPPRFYQTKPFVMLGKSYLCGTGRSGCIDYRKMTNGFVFLENATKGKKEPMMDGMDDVDVMDETRRQSGVATSRGTTEMASGPLALQSEVAR